MSTSTITIGIPVYNGERYLARSLESLVSQTRTPDEILVYDNASTDNSLQIAQSYAKRYAYIRSLSRPRNVGAAKNFNDLALLSNSAYFAWLCHDDEWGPQLLEQLVRHLDNHPSASAAFGTTRWIDAQSEVIGSPPLVIWSEATDVRERIDELLEDEIHSLLYDCNLVLGLIRGTALRQTRLIRPFPGGDLPLIFELALLGELHSVQSCSFYRRVHVHSSMAAFADTWARRQFFDPADHRPPADLLQRTLDYLRTTAKSELQVRDRIAIGVSILRWASRDGRPLRIGGQSLRRLGGWRPIGGVIRGRA